MSQQLDLFQEERKSKYQQYYDWFYRGVKERYKRESEERERASSEHISININNIIPKK